MEDDVKNFFTEFREYMNDVEIIKPETVNKHLRLFREAVFGPRGRESAVAQSGLTGQIICEMIREALTPGGFVYSKRPRISANYARMMVDSTKKVVEFLTSTENNKLHVPEAATLSTLRCIKKARSK